MKKQTLYISLAIILSIVVGFVIGFVIGFFRGETVYLWVFAGSAEIAWTAVVGAGLIAVAVVTAIQTGKANETNRKILEQAEEEREINAILENQRRNIERLRLAFDEFDTMLITVYFSYLQQFASEVMLKETWDIETMIGYTKYTSDTHVKLSTTQLGITLAMRLISSDVKLENDLRTTTELAVEHRELLSTSVGKEGEELEAIFEELKVQKDIGVLARYELRLKIAQLLHDAETQYQDAIHKNYSSAKLTEIFNQ